MVRTLRLAKESTKSLIDWECFISNKVSIGVKEERKTRDLIRSDYSIPFTNAITLPRQGATMMVKSEKVEFSESHILSISAVNIPWSQKRCSGFP